MNYQAILDFLRYSDEFLMHVAILYVLLEIYDKIKKKIKAKKENG